MLLCFSTPWVFLGLFVLRHTVANYRLTVRLNEPFCYTEISYSDFKSLIEKGEDLVIVDVRSKAEVDKGHIPGSIHIPVENVGSDLSLDPDAFKEKFGMPKPPLDAPNLVFHCQLGRRGEAATEKARSLGFQYARNFAGGYKEWSEKERK
ncbi:thiosulfate:glutathione sulfurtransferase-like isoform X1 [Pygocentrus nattereri]|uniref:thiosulfate:glutathione sulfurtransferase-like isoform X1 n=1 Tax=Pygocentrus nattereri TaxID=42514 RepID=UPI0008148B08|nr:thiosulfate:glutathione sulfurtransferase-like isoform X1 [Pygocentrus nattereri]